MSRFAADSQLRGLRGRGHHLFRHHAATAQAQAGSRRALRLQEVQGLFRRPRRNSRPLKNASGQIPALRPLLAPLLRLGRASGSLSEEARRRRIRAATQHLPLLPLLQRRIALAHGPPSDAASQDGIRARKKTASQMPLVRFPGVCVCACVHVYFCVYA